MIPKFRCWFKDTGTQAAHMVEWHELREFKALGDLLQYSGENKSFHLMQSTGLKDKNGVEIFEGDVLTSNVQPCKMVNPIKDGYGVVRFENGMFKLGSISLVTFISKMEVIGNIYENPELLDQSNES